MYVFIFALMSQNLHYVGPRTKLNSDRSPEIADVKRDFLVSSFPVQACFCFEMQFAAQF